MKFEKRLPYRYEITVNFYFLYTKFSKKAKKRSVIMKRFLGLKIKACLIYGRQIAVFFGIIQHLGFKINRLFH